MPYILVVLLVVASLPSMAWPTTYECRTTGSSSLWTDPAAWTDCNGTYPHNKGADTFSASIGNGHTVDIPSAATIMIGHDGGAGSVALRSATTSGTGVVTVNGVLQVRGHVQQANATWTVNAGGVIEGYSAVDDTNHRYQWQIGMASGSLDNSYLVLKGIGRNGGRVIVRTAAGSAARWGGFTNGATSAYRTAQTVVTGGLTGAGKIKADFVRFEQIGDLTGNKAYIGLTFNNAAAVESAVASDYQWSLAESDGIPNGSGGWTWIKYADSATSGISNSPSGKPYIGIACNKTSAAESENYADYSWSPMGGTGIKDSGGYTWVKFGSDRFGAHLADYPDVCHSIIVNAATVSSNDATWFEDCIFDGCSPVFIAMSPKSVVRIRRTSFLNPIARSAAPFDQSFVLAQKNVDEGGPDLTGQREIGDNAFQGTVLFANLIGMDIQRNVFVSGAYGTMLQGGGSVPLPAVFLDNILAKTNTVTTPNISFMPVPVDLETRTIVLQSGYFTDDFFRLTSKNGQMGNMYFNGYVIEREQGIPHSLLGGTVFAVVSTVPGTTLNFRNILNVPVWTDGIPASPSGALLVHFSTTMEKTVISNATWFSAYRNNNYGFAGFEVASGEIGGSQKVEMKNCLAANHYGSVGKWLYTTGASIADGTLSAHHNAISDFAPDTYLGRNIQPADFYGTIGASDIAGPFPAIGGPAWHFLAWMQARDPGAGVTTLTQAVNRLLTKNNDAGGTAVQHREYYDWIRTAYRPPPGIFGTSGISDDGVTPTYIGAVSPDNQADTTPPSITAFSVQPAAPEGAAIPVTIAASDASGGVTGYLLSETLSSVTLGTPGWIDIPASPKLWSGSGIAYVFNGAGPHTLNAWVRDAAGTVSARSSATVFIGYELGVTLNGTGGGSINSTPNGIHCSGGSCSATFAPGATVRLSERADRFSLFSAWGGACAGSAAHCDITMDSDKVVTVEFTTVPKVLFAGNPFDTVQGAYGDKNTSNDAFIRMLDGVDVGPLMTDRPLTVYLSGGYDRAYSSQIGSSIITGSVTVRQGTVIVDRIAIQ